MVVALAMAITGLTLNAQTVGEAGPDFEVTLLSGSSFKLSDQQGKVVLVFFFGNSCPSCKAAAPFVESDIFQEFSDNENFVAVGLDTWDSSSSTSSVTAFKNSTGVTFPLGVKAGDVASDYGSTYDRLLVIDQDGVLVHKGTGGAKNDIGNAVEAIQEVLTVMSIGSEKGISTRIKAYPVPANDVLYLQSDERIGQISIYDVGGKQVRSLNYEGGSSAEERTVSLAGLSGGMYFYQAETQSGIYTGKFLKR